MFLEAFEIIRRVWADENFVHHGTYWTVQKDAPLSPPRARGIVGSAIAVAVLIGCAGPVTTGSRAHEPAAGSGTAASTSFHQIGRPAVSDESSLSGSNVVRAGSFPRSLLIPGTNTSIRIGG